MIDIHVVDAFTTTPNEGNRAGVVLNADNLTAQQMQKIAAYVGYSETAFVLRTDKNNHTVRIRYFTPTAEVPVCGTLQ